MHTLCLSLVSLSLLIAVGLAHGVALRNSEEAKELAEKILVRVASGDADQSVALMKPYWPLPESELEALVAETTKQRQSMIPRLGKSLGFALVRRETLADIFLRLIYVEKLDNSGVRWNLTFYKVKDAWKLHSVSCDEDISKLLESR